MTYVVLGFGAFITLLGISILIAAGQYDREKREHYTMLGSFVVILGLLIVGIFSMVSMIEHQNVRHLEATQTAEAQ